MAPWPSETINRFPFGPVSISVTAPKLRPIRSGSLSAKFMERQTVCDAILQVWMVDGDTAAVAGQLVVTFALVWRELVGGRSSGTAAPKQIDARIGREIRMERDAKQPRSETLFTARSSTGCGCTTPLRTRRTRPVFFSRTSTSPPRVRRAIAINDHNDGLEAPDDLLFD